MKIHQNNFYQYIEYWIENDFQSVIPEEMKKILVNLFETNGYQVFDVPGDHFGSELKIEKEGISTLIFMYKFTPSESVDVAEIQHALSASVHHKTDHAMVITTSIFTEAAKELGDRSDVFLWDGDIFKEALTKTFLHSSITPHIFSDEDQISKTDPYFEFKVIEVIPDQYLPDKDIPITKVTLELTNLSGKNLQIYINLPVLIRHDKKQYTAVDWLPDGFSSGMIYQDAKVDLIFYFPESQLPDLHQGDEVMVALAAPALELQKTYSISLMPEDSRCFVVTYIFSKYSSSYWKAIRLRDEILLPTRPGRFLVFYYYRMSPRWIDYFKSNPFLLPFIQIGIKTILRLFPNRK